MSPSTRNCIGAPGLKITSHDLFINPKSNEKKVDTIAQAIILRAIAE